MRRNPRICPAEGSHIKTYYSSPVFANRLVGRYTVEWETEQGLQRLTACTRLADYEGNYPSVRSILSISQVLASYLERKRRPILRKRLPFLPLEAIRFLAIGVSKSFDVRQDARAIDCQQRLVDAVDARHDGVKISE